MNWVRVYNRLFELINTAGPTYFSGPRFLSKVRDVDPYFAGYNQLMEERQKDQNSTSRKDYFYDILLSFNEAQRLDLINAVLVDVREHMPEKVAALEKELGIAPKSEESMQARAPISTPAEVVIEELPTLKEDVAPRIPYPGHAKENAIKDFWNKHWQWVIGTAVAVASVVAAFVKG